MLCHAEPLNSWIAARLQAGLGLWCVVEAVGADAHSSCVGLEVANVGGKQKGLAGDALFLNPGADFAAVAGEGEGE